MKPELTPEDRAEFWRKRHDFLLASFTADKARFEYEALISRLNSREPGHHITAGSDGEPVYVPQPQMMGPLEKKREAS